MWTKAFWLDASERAVVAVAAALLPLLGAGKVDLLSVPWRADLGVALGALVVSVLTSIVGSQVGNKGTAALLPASSVPSGHPNKHEK